MRETAKAERGRRKRAFEALSDLAKALGDCFLAELEQVDLKGIHPQTAAPIEQLKALAGALLSLPLMPTTKKGLAVAAHQSQNTVGSWLSQLAEPASRKWVRGFLWSRPRLYRAVVNSPLATVAVWYFGLDRLERNGDPSEKWLRHFCPPDVARHVADTIAVRDRQYEDARAEVDRLKRTLASFPVAGADVGEPEP